MNCLKLWYSAVMCAALRCAKGATALEFAIVIPVLALLLFGIVQFSIVTYASSVLEGATLDAARTGKTGYPDVTSNAARLTYVTNLINQRIGGLLGNPQLLAVNVESYVDFKSVKQPEPCIPAGPPPCAPGPPSSWVKDVNYTDTNGNGQWDPDQGKVGDLGQGGEVTTYTVTYPLTIAAPMLSRLIGDGRGTFTLTSSAMVRNEPFTAKAPAGLAALPPPTPITNLPYIQPDWGNGCQGSCPAPPQQ